MLDREGLILAKAKILFTFHNGVEDIYRNMAAMSIYERENRRQRLDQVLGDQNGKNTKKASAGIFNKKQVSSVYQSFLRVRRPPLMFLLANDGTPLAYRVYLHNEENLEAVVVCITQNNIFQDVLASKMSKSMPLKVFVCELRGFGYSGGMFFFSF